MAKKSVVIIIVEGISEEISLENSMREHFRGNNIKFHVVESDITSDKYSTPKNIRNRISTIVKSVMDKNYYLKTDIERIVHIADIDGAYIDSSLITETSTKGYLYFDTHMEVINKELCERRNESKSSILDLLSMTDELTKIPYTIYYFCINLDHVLYNKTNLSNKEKIKCANSFQMNFYDKYDEFVKFINSPEFSAQNGYKQSWEELKDGANSLKRKTNINLLFKV